MKYIALLFVFAALGAECQTLDTMTQYMTNTFYGNRISMQQVGTNQSSRIPGFIYIVNDTSNMTTKALSLTNVQDSSAITNANAYFTGQVSTLSATLSAITTPIPTLTNLSGILISNTSSRVYFTNGYSGSAIIPANSLATGMTFNYQGWGSSGGGLTCPAFDMMVHWGGTVIASNAIPATILGSTTTDIHYTLEITVCAVTNSVAVIKTKGSVSVADLTTQLQKALLPFVIGSRIFAINNSTNIPVYGSGKFLSAPGANDYILLELSK